MFNDSTLKQGLRLVKEVTITIEKEPAGTRVFTFPTGEITRVNRKADKITGFKCSCGKKYCAHLAAGLFLFDKSLVDRLSKETIQRTENSNPFSKYRKLIKEKLEKGPGSEINKLLKQEKDQFYIILAAFCELNDNEDAPQANRCEEKLKILMGTHLNSRHQQALYEAAIALTSQKYFRYGAYSFIIPYVAIHLANSTFLAEIRERIEKRKSPAQSLTGVSEKEIALWHLMIAEEKLSGKKIPVANKGAEYYLALAQQYLIASNEKKLTRNLKDGFDQLLEKRNAKLVGYLERAIELAAACRDIATELFLIRQLFIYELYINPFYIERIKELLPLDGQSIFANTIIEAIKSQPESFDKHYHLLHSQGRYREAMQLVGQHAHKFRYANETMLLLEDIDKEDVGIYVKQFSAAILAASETHFQKRIFQAALKFLDRLTPIQRVGILKMMLDKLPRQSYIYQQINAHLTANLPA